MLECYCNWSVSQTSVSSTLIGNRNEKLLHNLNLKTLISDWCCKRSLVGGAPKSAELSKWMYFSKSLQHRCQFLLSNPSYNHSSPPPGFIIKHIHSHASPTTHRPSFGFTFLIATRNEWHVHRHTRRDASSRSSQVLLSQMCVLCMCVLYLLSSSPHQRYSLHPDTVKLDPTKPDDPGRTKKDQIPADSWSSHWCISARRYFITS